MLLKMMIYEYLEEIIFKQKPDYRFIFVSINVTFFYGCVLNWRFCSYTAV